MPQTRRGVCRDRVRSLLPFFFLSLGRLPLPSIMDYLAPHLTMDIWGGVVDVVRPLRRRAPSFFNLHTGGNPHTYL